MHGFMPSKFLLGCFCTGSLALLLRFGGCLKANIGGKGNTFNMVWILGCCDPVLFIIFETFGIFGLNVTTKISLPLLVLCFLLNVSFLPKDLAACSGQHLQ
jgi:hypothetical protein